MNQFQALINVTCVFISDNKNMGHYWIFVLFFKFHNKTEDSHDESEMDGRGQLLRVTGLPLKNLTAHQELPITGTADMLLTTRQTP